MFEGVGYFRNVAWFDSRLMISIRILVNSLRRAYSNARVRALGSVIARACAS